MPSFSALSERAGLPVLALGAALLPGAADAHAAGEGIRGFHAGLLHPFLSPAPVLGLLALALLLGLAWPRGAGAGFAAAAAGLAGGVAAGLSGLPVAAADLPLLLLALGAGGLAALRPGGAAAARLGLAGAGGALLGLAATPDAGPPASVAVTLAGSVVALLLGLLYGAAGVGAARASAGPGGLVPLGFRVGAAWVAALAAMLAALAASAPG